MKVLPLYYSLYKQSDLIANLFDQFNFNIKKEKSFNALKDHNTYEISTSNHMFGRAI